MNSRHSDYAQRTQFHRVEKTSGAGSLFFVFFSFSRLDVLTYRRWITLTLPKTATAEGPMRLSIPSASADSLLLTTTASSRPLADITVLIALLGRQRRISSGRIQILDFSRSTNTTA